MEEKYKKAIEDAKFLAESLLKESELEHNPEYLEYRSLKNKVDIQGSWLRFWWKANRITITQFSAAASVILLVSILIFSKSHSDNTSLKLQVTSAINLMPSQSSVLLKLASGEMIALDSVNDKPNSKLSGIVVDASKGQISYMSLNEPIKTLEQTVFQQEYNELSIPKGRSYALVLSDGTKVWLNALSKLSYPVKFSQRERRVKISGEAFFEVTHDDKHPFIVETSNYDVKVLGTRFNVNAYPDEKVVATTLLSGSIEIPNSAKGAVKIKVGEQYRYNTENNSTSVTEVDVELYSQWMDDILRIENMPLSSILKIIQRRYDIKIEVIDPQAGDEVYTGKIPLNDNLGVILEQLQKVSDVTFLLENGVLKVKTK